MMYPQQIARRVQDLLAHDGEKTFEDRNSALAETSGPSNDVNEDATVSGRDENDYDGDDDESVRINIEDAGVIGHTGARALDLYIHINWNPG